MITTRSAVVRHPEGDLCVRLVSRETGFALLIETKHGTAMVPCRQSTLRGALNIFDEVVSAARALCVIIEENPPAEEESS